MIVGDIPIEDQASEKAQEIALLYDDKGWVDRRDYTWLLYARAGMSDLELEDLRDQIISTIQNWKRTHGLDDNLYALIADLARAGVIWKPIAPTAELETETLWLWKAMGFDAIRSEALRAGGLALKEEAVAIQERLAQLDKIADLPKQIVMGTAAAALKKAKPILAKYLEERNKTVQFIYDNYGQMSSGLKAEADEIIRKIRRDDATISAALAKVGMRMADFGTAVPLQTLGLVTGATVAVTITLLIVALIAYITHAITRIIGERVELAQKQLDALARLQEESYAAIETERLRRIAKLGPEFSAEEREKEIAAINARAAHNRRELAAEYSDRLQSAIATIQAARKPLIKPWMWWAGGAASLPLAYWAIKRAVLGAPPRARPREVKPVVRPRIVIPPEATAEEAAAIMEEAAKKARDVAEAERKRIRAKKEAKRRARQKYMPWVYAGGTLALLITGGWIARWFSRPPPPAARLPNPETPKPPALPAPESTS